MTDLNNTVQDRIDDDYKAAFKSRNKEVTTALRFILSVIKQKTIDERRELTNDDVEAILRTEVKKRKDALKDFEKGGREDLMQQVQFELGLIEKYLPAQMDDAALAEIVKATIAEVGASGPADTGKVMGAVMAKVKGQADGNRVKEAVQAQLA